MSLPPLHPILVTFTAAMIPASVLSELLGRLFRKPSLALAAWWMLAYGAIVTPLTVAAGWLWLRSMPPMDVPEMTLHKWLGTELAIVFIALAWCGGKASGPISRQVGSI